MRVRGPRCASNSGARGDVMGLLSFDAPAPVRKEGLLSGVNYPKPSEDDVWMASMREQAGLHAPYTRTPVAQQFTQLTPDQEQAFRQWLATPIVARDRHGKTVVSNIPFNPNDPISDYDMRGYWRDVAAAGGSGVSINPNDGKVHFPDDYKTAYHQSFSNESRYATPQAPHWIPGDRLQRPDGQIVFDEPAMVRARRKQK